MAGQGRGGNEGMSGKPMWQIKQKMALFEKERETMVEALIRENEEKRRPAEVPNILVDATAAGGPTDSQKKPLIRHLIVKDINKVAQLKNIELPTSDLFVGKAPMALYAVFDGQVGASPGAAAADFCAKNLYMKVLENLAMLRQGSGTIPFIKAALIRSFLDVDAEYIAQAAPDVDDGCAVALALSIGNHVFLATLGESMAILAEVDSPGVPPSAGGLAALPTASAQGCLGCPSMKKGPNTATRTPEVFGVELKDHLANPFLILGSMALRQVMEPAQVVSLVADYQFQPKAACCEIAEQALAALAVKSDKAPPQMVVIQACFLPPKISDSDPKAGSAASSAGPPPAKKAKVVGKSKSLRLRHIMIRVQDPTGPPTNAAAAAKAKAAAANAGGKPPKPKAEAEALLRGILKDLAKDLSTATKAPKTPNDLVVFQGKRFQEFCKKHSDCPTAQKGGAMCGDMGWVSLEELAALGGSLKEKVEPLSPGQWSDICSSDRGYHLVQRVA